MGLRIKCMVHMYFIPDLIFLKLDNTPARNTYTAFLCTKVALKKCHVLYRWFRVKVLLLNLQQYKSNQIKIQKIKGSFNIEATILILS